MGQKINPFGFRLVSTSGHLSSWYSDKVKYPSLILEDFAYRDAITKELQTVLVLLSLYIYRVDDYTKLIAVVLEPTLEEVYSSFIDYIVCEPIELKSASIEAVNNIDEAYFFENVNIQKTSEDIVEVAENNLVFENENDVESLSSLGEFFNVCEEYEENEFINNTEHIDFTEQGDPIYDNWECEMPSDKFFTQSEPDVVETAAEPTEIENVTPSQFMEYGYPFLVDLYKKSMLESISSLNTKMSIEFKILTDDEPNASFVAQFVRQQIRSRVNFRRIVLMCTELYGLGESGGFKLEISGRLDGLDLARTEWIRKGAIPLQTVEADIDYAQEEIYTMAGVIGIKVWIFYK